MKINLDEHKIIKDIIISLKDQLACLYVGDKELFGYIKQFNGYTVELLVRNFLNNSGQSYYYVPLDKIDYISIPAKTSDEIAIF